MNNQSLVSFNKINKEMERLSMLISKEDQFKKDLKNALINASQSDSEDSALQNIDLYFQQYNNPTTKSLPFDPEPQFSSQNLEGDSETIGTIYRNQPIDFQEEGDRDCNPDDKSTVILAALKNVQKKEKLEQEPVFIPTASIPNYSSLDKNPRISKKESLPVKTIKSNSKNATTSIPSEVRSREHYKSQNHLTKNSSIAKGNPKIESPIMGLAKKKQAQYENEDHQLGKDIRSKNPKISKIDSEELSKLQQKKVQKKSEASSNRKKTKRSLGTAKSTSNMAKNGKFGEFSANYLSQKSNGNSSSKKLEGSKKDFSKKDEKFLLNHQDWLRMEKNNKKLNRVNICKLQENMKKINDKKNIRDPSANRVEKKSKKTPKFQSYHKAHEELKLHFTEDDDTPMKKLIKEKELNKEYSKQTNKYLQNARKISKPYFQLLIKQCREASEEAILKINLVTLIVYFFDQFTETCLLSYQKCNPNDNNFFESIPQEQIIQVLLHPKKILKVIQNLPSILMNDNVMSSERIKVFLSKFGEVNQQLDQELEFFLIKKETLYSFVHVLSEYIHFLIQKDLVAQTKRSKVLAIKSNEPLHGFYSGRSKRDEISKKHLKTKQIGNKLGFRCDSDRKITLEDEDFCFKEISKGNRKEPHHKSTQLKKIFK